MSKPTLVVEFDRIETAPRAPSAAHATTVPSARASSGRRRFIIGGAVALAGLLALGTLSGRWDDPSAAPGLTPATQTAMRTGRPSPTPSPPLVTTAAGTLGEAPNPRPTSQPTLSPTPRPTPTPRATPAPRPTPVPTPRPIPAAASLADLPMTEWDARLSWRWLEGHEFDCPVGTDGCWGLLVLPSTACPEGLAVTLDVEDAAGRFVGSVTESRRSARRDRGQVLILEAPNLQARSASIADMSCGQRAPRRTPERRERPEPRRRPAPRPQAGRADRPAPRGNCDPSYPGVCIRAYPPDLDCGQVAPSDFRVRGRDPHGFDADNDGIGCES